MEIGKGAYNGPESLKRWPVDVVGVVDVWRPLPSSLSDPVANRMDLACRWTHAHVTPHKAHLANPNYS